MKLYHRKVGKSISELQSERWNILRCDTRFTVKKGKKSTFFFTSMRRDISALLTRGAKLNVFHTCQIYFTYMAGKDLTEKKWKREANSKIHLEGDWMNWLSLAFSGPIGYLSASWQQVSASVTAL